jgi:hypothetical protein
VVVSMISLKRCFINMDKSLEVSRLKIEINLMINVEFSVLLEI